MIKTAIIMFIAAAVIAAINIAIIIYNNTRVKAYKQWHESNVERHRLKEYQKRRMCNSYCKFKESAKTEEELEWKCANCPIAEL